MSDPLVLISCGETSGDVYAAAVAQALRERRPRLRLAGIGGGRLRDAGVDLWADLDQLSVMGFLEVVRHLPRLRRLRNDIAARAVGEQADLLITVDYPGFHLELARAMRRRGIPTLAFVPPKTWSWGAWRNRSLRRAVERCAVIFRFEEDYYRSHGIDATFVGHPLVDRYQQDLAGPEPTRAGLLLVPGSRRQELHHIAPVLGEFVRRLTRERPQVDLKVSRASSVAVSWLAPITDAGDVEVVEGPLFPALREARAAIVTSGTATMEAALALTPHVIVYRTSGISYFLARRLVTVEHIGMGNIVLGRRAVPELLQGDLRAPALVGVIEELLDPAHPSAHDQRAAFAQLRQELGGPGAFDRVADLALAMLDRPRS